MRDAHATAEKVRDYVNRQMFPVSIPMVAERLHVNHASATNTASRQIALGLWRRAADGRVMGVNCHLPLDWTDDVTHHMDPGLLEACLDERVLIDAWRTGVWLATDEIHVLTGVPLNTVHMAFNRAQLPCRMILGKCRALYEDVIAWELGRKFTTMAAPSRPAPTHEHHFAGRLSGSLESVLGASNAGGAGDLSGSTGKPVRTTKESVTEVNAVKGMGSDA